MTDKAIIAVFDNQNAAYDAATALQDAAKKSSDLKIKAGVIVAKDAKGNFSVLKEKDRPLWGTIAGTAVGALIGLLAGPAGAAAGAAVGASAGLVGDAFGGAIDADFAGSITADLNPGNAGIIMEADEGSTEVVDAVVRRFNGRVRRQNLE